MSTPAPPPTEVPQRYRLLAQLGEGGMGVVSRAYDRLQHHEVALKQVLLPPDLTPTEVEAELLTLAHEFRTLAGLRHPHIISVLDFGFDAQRRPFFTMELLRNAHTILEFGRELPRAAQVETLIQAAEALAYLHRRRVLHHDLKPENILIADEHLRLLDFGLAVLTDQQRSDDAFGTLRYLAPEVLDAQPYTEQADLYSLGVIAYELLVGRHPWQATTTREFFDRVLSEPPDLTPLADAPALAQLLGQLLAKTAGERPASAQALIAALRQVLDRAAMGSDRAIRESYLQAARFVGRDAELAQLRGALATARQGQGSTWLIGGESGVGKSRLLDELRTQALVAGFAVLRGQAVEGGGRPYELWREPLRRLVLEVELSDLEASVLKDLVPDIANLLMRPVPDAPVLVGAAGQQRLVMTISDLFARLRQPALLLLEDLQWSAESLLLLNPLLQRAAGWPILAVGTFRDDEAPSLPQQLPAMVHMHLPRLSADETAALSRSILGEAGSAPELVTLLQRETEGNSFFLVEVVRVLAEEAGDLATIGQSSLPSRVLAGGVQQVVQRWLARAPESARAALEIAAVVGRQIDQAVLAAALPTLDQDAWLGDCAEAAVLEIAQEHWRFSHDKLREGLLLALDQRQVQALHAQVIEAIEQVYAANLETHAAVLAAHAAQAEDRARERHYALLAGKLAARQYANEQALAFLARALELTAPEDDATRYAILLVQEQIDALHGEREQQQQRLEALDQVALRLGDPYAQAEACARRADYFRGVGNYNEAVALAARALELLGEGGPPVLRAGAERVWGAACVQLARYAEAVEHLTLAQLPAEYDQPALENARLSNLGLVYANQGQFERAGTYFAAALQQANQLGDRRGQVRGLFGLGWVQLEQDQLVQAADSWEHALTICRSIEAVSIEANLLSNLGALTLRAESDWMRATALFGEALALARQIDDRATQVLVFLNLAQIAYQQGDLASVEQQASQALELALQLGDQRLESVGSWLLGSVALERAQPELATERLAHALSLAQRASEQGVIAEASCGLAQLALQRGSLAEALSLVEPIIAPFLQDALTSNSEPARVGLACYTVLRAAGDPRADVCLAHAAALIERVAARIPDPQRRAVFRSFPIAAKIQALQRGA